MKNNKTKNSTDTKNEDKKNKDSLTKKRSFSIEGMTCANCARNVERALGKVDEVAFAAVNLATETAFVNLKKPVDQEFLEKAVSSAGYSVSYERAEDIDEQKYRTARMNLLLGWVITLPLMVLMVLHMIGVKVPGFVLMELVGGAFVIAVAGRHTLRGAWIAGVHGHTNMDTLITAGSIASWATSLLHITGVPIHSFGAIGAMIVALHLTGRFIESHLRDRAAKAIKSLVSIQAKEARVVLESGEETGVPIEAVKEGFLVRVRAGERIPADGVIHIGASSIDESMITGEPIPVRKEPSSPVTGGSLNLNSTLDIKVTKVGDDTFLANMIQLIQEAQGAKIPIQALADKITKYFVPAIIALALLTGITWYFAVDRLSPLLDWANGFLPWVLETREPLTVAVFALVSTLVIACPCALGLATPMALIAGTGKASKAGLIIRNAESIGTAREVGTVLMDKTGTITEGKPRVVYHDLDETTARLVAKAEKESTHPLARAISALAESNEGKTSDNEQTGDNENTNDKEQTSDNENTNDNEQTGDNENTNDNVNANTIEPLKNLEERAGKGIFFSWRGDDYSVGKPADSARYTAHLEKGHTIVEVQKNGAPIGFIAITDPLRPDTIEAIKNLKSLGIRPVMATGDNETTARILAMEAEIDSESIYAGLRPEDKLEIIRDLQTEGRKVLMVGDGMNDAAALKGADIGVAIGTGTDLAIDNADIIIVKGGISKVVDAITISRKTFKIIRQNLFWAFAYNIIAIPLAMAALLHPAIAEGAMAFSSISVVFNSGRIK